MLDEEVREELLEHAPAKTLIGLYSIGTWKTTHELLVRVAQRRGRLRKGGVPDSAAAIKIIQKDVMDGRIPFWTEVPSKEQEEREKEILEGKMVDDDEEEDQDEEQDESMEDEDDDDEDDDEEEEDDRLDDDEEEDQDE